MLTTFNKLEDFYINKKNEKILKFTTRKKIIGFKKRNYYFKVGDVIEVVFFRKTTPLVFKGICLTIRNKKLINPNATFILRNVLIGVGIEITCAFYYNRLYKFKFHDFRKKMHYIRSSKIFFIRKRVNKESQVGD